jgi:hypothetical protein
MAYTSAPEKQTNATERTSLVHDIDIIPGFTDLSFATSGMTNILAFRKGEELYGETRDTISGNTVLAGGTCICRGMYVWEKTAGTVYYYVVTTDGTNSRVYTSTTGLNGSWSNVTTLTNNATTPVRFTEFIDSTNVKKLVLVDGLEGYVFTTNAAGTKIVDADFPTPHVPFPVFIDGYLFLAKAGTGDIYNSDLNDPALWTAGSFISSELYPDDVVALVKVNNYLLAIGKEGSEFFYDAANATASPLAREQGASLPFGTVFPNSIASNKDTVVLLAQNNDGSSVFKVIEGFKHADFPAPVILRVLSTQLSQSQISASSLRAYFIRQNGELFYVLNSSGTSIIPSITNTLVANLKEKQWVNFAFGGTTNDFPAMVSAPSTSGSMNTYVAGQYYGVVFFGKLIPNADYDTLDNGSVVWSIQQRIKVPPNNYGTLNRKFMSRLAINYQRNVETFPIKVQYSDDMMQTFSTQRDLIGYTTGSTAVDGGFPFLTQLGSFRQRGFSIYVASTKVRWLYLEVDINKGQQ